MKRNIMAITLSLCSLALAKAQSSDVGQWSVTPRLGVSIAKMSDAVLSVSVDDNLSPRNRTGLVAGADIAYRLTNRLGFTFGALYTENGCRYPVYSNVDENGEGTGYDKVDIKLQYVNFPLLVEGYLVDGLAVKAGVQVGYLVNSKTSMTTRSISKDNEGNTVYGKEETTTSDYGIARKVNLSIPIGLSYEYMNVVLDARYNIGITRIDKFTDSKNRFFTLTVGYRFAL